MDTNERGFQRVAMKTAQWVIKNLREFGNCYVKWYPEIKEIEKILKKKITVRPAELVGEGWIIEVVKK